jgi:hypothetical protein
MTEFYRLTDAAGRPRLSRDLVGRMYRLLDEARHLSADEPRVRARVTDLVLYTRYVEMYHAYAYAAGEERQRGFEALLRHSYRIRPTGMVHSLGVWRFLQHVDRAVKLPPDTGYEVPEGKNPWKDATPFAPQEIQDLLVAGIARNPVSDIAAVKYSADLVPATPLGLPDVPAGNMGAYLRDRAIFYTRIAEPPEALALTVKGGLIYQNLGPAKIALFRAGATEATERSTVPPDQKEHAIRLRPQATGLHRVEMLDRSSGTTVTPPTGIPWTIAVGPEEATELYGRWTLYFYVPKGTKVVAGYAEGIGEMQDAEGKTVFTFGNRPDYFEVKVAPGQDGRLWKFANCMGRRLLLTVPPYLARDGRELQLPAEVVRADARK